MTLLRKLEVGFGVATLVLSLAATVVVEVPRVTPGFMVEQVLGIAVYLAPAVLVFLGACFDAAKRRTAGLVMLWFGGLLLTLWLIVGVFGGVLYLYGLWGGLAMIGPSAPAIASMIASLLVRRSGIKE
jgi:hypothetical protein